ncbi:MAG TPA: hypothetical protein VEQ42_02400, partial [Pyrinomonadaceae bacterium]|nr:hypothetical protein [Pyrinomonadaceae bacterium]
SKVKKVAGEMLVSALAEAAPAAIKGAVEPLAEAAGVQDDQSSGGGSKKGGSKKGGSKKGGGGSK